MNLTVEMLRQAARNPVETLNLEILMWKFERPSYSKWVGQLERFLLHITSLIGTKRDRLKGLSEDALTSIFDISFQAINISSSAKAVNGNVDLAIEYEDYMWLGEAKIAHSVSVIYGGYLQLTSRYTTGMLGQTSGGMLLYCQDERADVTIAGWKAALSKQVSVSNVQPGPTDLSFRSSDMCAATGATLDILHLAVPLHHEPQEELRKLSPASSMAARKARDEVKARNKAAK